MHTCTHNRAAISEHSHAHNNTKINFRKENFRDQKSNHEIYENIVPRKFGAIRYFFHRAPCAATNRGVASIRINTVPAV